MKTCWYKSGAVGFLFVLLLFIASSCSTQPSTRVDGGGKGPFQIDVQVTPNPALILKENEFRVTVKDLNGTPVNQAKVGISLSMANMDHGDLKVAVTSLGNGSYTGKGIPVMAGEWIATVNVEDGGKSSTVNFYFQASR